MRRLRPTIQFLCRAKRCGVIAEPMPARNELPDWFRRLPGVDRDHLFATNDGVTVKRCPPFLDALATGWIVPLAATIRLEVRDDGKHVEAGWEFDRTMVSNHSAFQIAGNPDEPRPPMKIHNYWTVRTAPGWSCLFVPALNRPNGVIDVLSGVVDTDVLPRPSTSRSSPAAPDGVHVLPKGTPSCRSSRSGGTRPDPGLVRAETDRNRSTGPHAPQHHGRRRLVPPPRPS